MNKRDTLISKNVVGLKPDIKQKIFKLNKNKKYAKYKTKRK